MPYAKNKKFRQPSKAVKNYVQRTISKNIETKQRDLSWDCISIQDPGRTPIASNLIDLSQGDTQNTRAGNQVFVTGFYGKFVVAGADTTNIVRMVVYIPRDPTDTLAADTIGVTSLIDQDSYTVLYDKYITTSSAGENAKVFTVAKNFHRGSRKGLRVIWNGVGTTDITKNFIKLYVVSDSGAVSDPCLSGHLRTYYKDA